MGKKQSFQKCFQETGYLHAKKRKLDLYLTLYANITQNGLMT